MPPESSPRSETRTSPVPPPLPEPEDSTEIREKLPLAAPEDLDSELDDAFFNAGSSPAPEVASYEPEELDEERENPALSPEQLERRRRLRRQVLLLMVVLALFSLAVLVPRLAV
jgi:hypothetical protein